MYKENYTLFSSLFIKRNEVNNIFVCIHVTISKNVAEKAFLKILWIYERMTKANTHTLEIHLVKKKQINYEIWYLT